MKKILSLFLTLVLCAGLVIPASAAGFSDVPADYWAKEAINRAVSDGVVGGYPDGTFRPASAVSYGAFSLMLARAFYSGELAAYPSGGTEAGEAIMNRHNILNDTSRASRSGGAELPREDMAQCMYNLLVDLGMSIPSASEYAKAMSFISDYDTVSGNCRRGVLVCYTLGLLGGLGDGSFGPQKSMNRAQAAVVIGRLQDYVQNSGGTADVVEIPSGPEPKAPPVETPVEKPVEASSAMPTVIDWPELKLEPGQTINDLMRKINAATSYTPGYLANGKPITEENMAEFFEMVKRNFPEGTEWNQDLRYNYTSPKFGDWLACNAWGYMLSDALFTDEAPLTRHQNFDQLKVGDVVWIKNSVNGYDHAIVITSINKETGRYTACSGNQSGAVCWTHSGRLSTIYNPEQNSASAIYSRY